MAALLIVAPVGVALIAVVLGRAARDDAQRWASARLLVFAAVVAAAAAGVAATQIDPTVPGGDVVQGLLLAAALGAFAVAAFYSAGYLVRRSWLLAIVLVAAVAPYFLFLFFSLLYVMDLVDCGPDAYECPL